MNISYKYDNNLIDIGGGKKRAKKLKKKDNNLLIKKKDFSEIFYSDKAFYYFIINGVCVLFGENVIKNLNWNLDDNFVSEISLDKLLEFSADYEDDFYIDFINYSGKNSLNFNKKNIVGLKMIDLFDNTNLCKYIGRGFMKPNYNPDLGKNIYLKKFTNFKFEVLVRLSKLSGNSDFDNYVDINGKEITKKINVSHDEIIEDKGDIVLFKKSLIIPNYRILNGVIVSINLNKGDIFINKYFDSEKMEFVSSELTIGLVTKKKSKQFKIIKLDSDNKTFNSKMKDQVNLSQVIKVERSNEDISNDIFLKNKLVELNDIIYYYDRILKVKNIILDSKLEEPLLNIGDKLTCYLNVNNLIKKKTKLEYTDLTLEGKKIGFHETKLINLENNKLLIEKIKESESVYIFKLTDNDLIEFNKIKELPKCKYFVMVDEGIGSDIIIPKLPNCEFFYCIGFFENVKYNLSFEKLYLGNIKYLDLSQTSINNSYLIKSCKYFHGFFSHDDFYYKILDNDFIDFENFYYFNIEFITQII